MTNSVSSFNSISFQNRDREAFEALATHFESFSGVHQAFVAYDAVEDGFDRGGNRQFEQTETPLHVTVNTVEDIPENVSDEAIQIAQQYNLEISTDTIPGAYSQISFQPLR